MLLVLLDQMAFVCIFSAFWHLIKADLILLVRHFYHNSLRIAKLNQAMLCLLPKGADASVIQKFRPIILVNWSYKII
jgi:hypothetical protein